MTEVNQTKILDLDDFVPADKVVIISKKEYRIRGNASVKMTLALMAAAENWQRAKQTPDSVRLLLEAIKGFFLDEIEIDVLESLDLAGQLPKLIAFLYGAEIKKGDEKNGESRAE